MRTLLALALAGSLASCGKKDEPARDEPPRKDPPPPSPAPAPPDPAANVTAKLDVASSAFTANGEIPSDNTCEGGDKQPPLTWSGAPPATKSFALIVDDPDAPDPAAPKRTWVHYVVANIPGNLTGIVTVHPDAIVGTNDWNKREWGGPCPPIGRHRYFFKVYALDTTFDKPMTKAELLTAMTGHVLAKGELIGTYQKKKP